MKFYSVCLAIILSVTLATAQYFGSFGQFGGLESSRSGFYGLNAINGDYAGATAFGGSAANLRDARQDRGPVVFPASPDDAPVESSGVIIGASGYGFVPPQNGQSKN